jgi:mono/diheme cytochrome c family protein
LTRWQGEWGGYSYRWNAEQTDATLVSKLGQDVIYEDVVNSDTSKEDASKEDVVKGGREFADNIESLKWRFPSRAECMVCHSRAANFVLGASTAQLNRSHDYGHDIVANQLDVWKFLGMAFVEPPKKKEGEDKPEPFKPDKFANPYDKTLPLEQRARAYLHSNCAQCHVGAGGGNSQFDVAFHTAAKDLKLVGVDPLHDRFDLKDAKLVVAGAPERSLLLHRMSIRGRGQMPQLATNRVDREAVEMLSQWIRQMK